MRTLTRKILDYTNLTDLNYKIPHNYLRNRVFVSDLKTKITHNLNAYFTDQKEQQISEVQAKISLSITPIKIREKQVDTEEQSFNSEKEFLAGELAKFKVQLNLIITQNKQLLGELSTKQKAEKVAFLTKKQVASQNQKRLAADRLAKVVEDQLMERFGVLQDQLDGELESIFGEFQNQKWSNLTEQQEESLGAFIVQEQEGELFELFEIIKRCIGVFL
eukprot:EST41398.1 Hypothetical protein SS50377_19115 [Spironucleus salmonicida]